MTTGHAHGAVTVINATATGRGAALAVRGGVEAAWQWEGDTFRWQNLDVDDRLAQAVFPRMQAHLRTRAGAIAGTRSTFPPSRGLKTSSSAAAALVRAAARAHGTRIGDEDVETIALAAGIDAGVTLTGAYDDLVATVRGGCHVTDNRVNKVLDSFKVRPWPVAVWVPEARIRKEDVAGIDATGVAKDIEHAEGALYEGDIPLAMTLNGDAFFTLYQEAGLPVTERPARAALEAGALGAGLSGTGPAVAAVFRKKRGIPAVEGGTWHWTEAVP